MEKNHRDVSTEIVLILDKERGEIEGQLSQLQLECLKRKRRGTGPGSAGRNGRCPSRRATGRASERDARGSPAAAAATAGFAVGDSSGRPPRRGPPATFDHGRADGGPRIDPRALGLNPKFTEAVSGVENRVIAEHRDWRRCRLTTGPATPSWWSLSRASATRNSTSPTIRRRSTTIWTVFGTANWGRCSFPWSKRSWLRCGCTKRRPPASTPKRSRRRWISTTAWRRGHCGAQAASQTGSARHAAGPYRQHRHPSGPGGRAGGGGERAQGPKPARLAEAVPGRPALPPRRPGRGRTGRVRAGPAG